MFGRIFGRGKDETDQTVCSQCGRTLLAGEWTQKVTDADGNERLICSLCGQTQALGGAEVEESSPVPANDGRVRESRVDASSPSAPTTTPVGDNQLPTPVREPRAETRDESDAFWKALKEKDAEIECLRAQLARSEAEKQELAGRLALAQGTTRSAAAAGSAAAAAAAGNAEPPTTASAEATPVAPGAVPAEPLVRAATSPAESAAQLTPPRATGDSSEPGERTWGETPAEFAAELAAIRQEEEALAGQPHPADPSPASVSPPVASAGATPAAEVAGHASSPEDAAAPVQPVALKVPAVVFEDTQPIPAIGDELITTPEGAASVTSAPPVSEVETTLTPEPGLSAPTPTPPEPTVAELEAEAASLTLLQRGVDLLNVSRVPSRIAETNEQLGLPSVHVGFDGHATAVTFIWSMGWYRFEVDSESGDVRMADRGYDDLADLRPNASVRADGTVQLAPAQISRAATQRAPSDGSAIAPVSEVPVAPVQPEPPSVAAQKPPEILSKSLLGQRSDDEAASWEKTQAREFDWDR